jgi:hypothetical protein
MLSVSCDAGRLRPEGRPVSEVWQDGATGLRLSAAPSPLRAEREIPVLSPPEVFAVYVPSHVDRNRDLMIGEHWVFLKLKDGDWFIEAGEPADPAAAGDASSESLAPLRSLDGFDRAVVPWRGEGR